MLDRAKVIPGPCYDEAYVEAQKQLRERSGQRRDRFMSLYAEWLLLRSNANNPSYEDETCEAADTRADREHELALLITATPAELPWMIFLKFEVLEFYMCDYGEGGNWRDQREVRMLAGIKADLMKFKLEERS